MSVLHIATKANPVIIFPILLAAKHVLMREPETTLEIQYDAEEVISISSFAARWVGPHTSVHSDDDILPAMRDAFVSLSHGGDEVR